MIIKDASANSTKKISPKFWNAVFCCILLIMGSFFMYQYWDIELNKPILLCDAEKVQTETLPSIQPIAEEVSEDDAINPVNNPKEREVFITDSYLCRGGKQSKKYAYEGKYSCKLDTWEENRALQIIYPIKDNQSVKVSVWRKYTAASDEACLVLEEIGSNPDRLQIKTYRVTTSSALAKWSDWAKIEQTIQLNRPLHKNKLKIYVEAEQGIIYFDNLELELSPTQTSSTQKDTIIKIKQGYPKKVKIVKKFNDK
ncbi:MAG: hypothetical protein MK212_11640 [Saprospiraceae bacterium]|nr:hypothetical protein [Saprospiraceae bacterium]